MIKIGIGIGITSQGSGGGAPTLLAQSALVDGVMQMLSNQRAVVRDGATYTLSMTGKLTGGAFEVTRIVDGEAHTFLVRNNWSSVVDDHSPNGLLVLSDGRLLVLFGSHGGDVLRYRISSASLPNLEAGFGADRFLPTLSPGTGHTYGHIWSCADGYVRIITRNTAAGWAIYRTTMASLVAGTETWTASRVFENDTYFSAAITVDGSRIDLISVTGNAATVGGNALKSLYCTFSGGTESWFTQAGASLTTPIDTVVSGTSVNVVADNNYIAQDIAHGADGNPRVLFARSPKFTDGNTPPNDAVTYAHGRWTGSAWTVFDFATGEPTFPDANHQLGSISFDRVDPTILYFSKRVGSVNEIIELKVDETAQTTTETRAITSGSTLHQCRPFSPYSRVDGCRVVWVEREAGWVSFENFESNLRFYGTELAAALPEPVAYETESLAIFAAMTAPTTNEKVRVDRVVKALKTGTRSGNNIWTKLRSLMLPAIMESEANATLDLIRLATVTKSGSPTFTPLRGFLGSNSSAADWYAGVAPNTLSGYQVNDWFVAGMGGRRRIAGTLASIFRQGASVGTQIGYAGAGTVRVNGATATAGTASGLNGYPVTPGFYVGNRTGASANAYFKGYDQYATNTNGGSSQSNPVLFASEASGYMMFSAFGLSLTANEIADLQIAVHKAVRQTGTA